MDVTVDPAHPTGEGGPRPRLLWLTNFAAPYRRPVWRELSRSFELRVLLTNDSAEAIAHKRDAWLGLEERAYRLEPAAVRRTRLGHRGELRGPAAIGRAVRESDAVLLGGWEEPFYWQALVSAKRHRVPAFGFYESTKESQSHPTGPVDWVRSAFFRALAGVVTPGPMAARAISAMGVPPDRIHTGFNAVDVRAFHEVASASPDRVGVGSGPGHRFVYIGQLIHRKNVHSLIEAFTRIAAEGDHLTIIGSGALEEDLRAQARRTSVPDQVTFVGDVAYDDLPAALAAEHTLVLPSTEEVWGLVVNEALAAGLGVVVSEKCGVSESVAGMRGVTVCGTEVTELAPALTAARDAWTGWIADPEILQMTPERFAHVFRDCVMPCAARSATAQR